MTKPKPTLVERRSPWVVFTRADALRDARFLGLLVSVCATAADVLRSGSAYLRGQGLPCG